MLIVIIRGLAVSTGSRCSYNDFFQELVQLVSKHKALEEVLKLCKTEYVSVLKFLVKECVRVGCMECEQNIINPTNSALQNPLWTLCKDMLKKVQVIPAEIFDVLFSHLLPAEKEGNLGSFHAVQLFIKENLLSLECEVSKMIMISLENLYVPSLEMCSTHMSHILKELYAVIPSTISKFLPLLVPKLKDEKPRTRQIGVLLVGRMFASSSYNLSVDMPHLWSTYLQRFSDQNEVIREECLKFLPTTLIHHPELRRDLTGVLARRLFDPHYLVRIAAIKAFASVAQKKPDCLDPEVIEAAYIMTEALQVFYVSL
ncbi:hypothetical protein AB6A40_000547 [Gnathostoma spinigerum]|uniref:Uncharacterized protein n=1 Tax=Gnathostoma spinigerum TaxID=75299 RepID=A0ABD6E2C0_9BILA